MAWTLCTSQAAIVKAGANANANIIISGARLAEFSDQVEGTISARTRKDWVADFSSVTTNFKPVLADLASDLIAMKIVNYDMSGYTSRLEAQTMLDVLRDNAVKNLEFLENDNVKEIMD